MVKDDSLRNYLGAALVSAGGEVPLDHLESLLREKFELELPSDANHGTLEKYLVANFADICRVKKATDGHFVVRVLSLQSITHLLPPGYNEPEFEPLTTPEISIPLSSPKPVNPKPANAKPAIVKPAIVKPAIVKPATVKPVNAKPAIVKPANAKPANPAANIPNVKDHSERPAMKSAGLVKAPIAQSRTKFNSVPTKVEYQDDRDASLVLANLENQLMEECSVRGIIEPTFTITTSGGNLREKFCVATWGNEKIQSHPGVFATEVGAKAYVIKKILSEMDEFVHKITHYQSSLDTGNVQDAPADQCADQDFVNGHAAETETIPEPAMEKRFCENGRRVAATDLEPDPKIQVDTGVQIVPPHDEMNNDENSFAEHIASPVLSIQSTADISRKQAVIGAPLAPNHPVIDLEPHIDMEKPLSHGYLSCVLADGAFMVQVKGPGLDKWERQTYAFDPRSPSKKVVPLRWCVVHVKESSEVEFFDRAMCMSEEGPCYDERGFMKLYFPDNGYEDFIDPQMIFDLDNYDEINRVPVQGVRIHAVGLTGNTPVNELNVTHPPHHELLFLPADRATCFMSNCSEEVPHVYIYDTVIKRVLC